jgi:hypothetical protein
MTTLKASASHTLTTPVRVTVRPITIALIALLIAAALALTIALATSGEAEQPGAPKSVRVAPSAPIPPSPAQRDQPPGLNGPGMRP